ncbi:MAG TPA: alpha/beta fold hydrolase [Thermoanaerobaculia bacterium]|nr:alpha/beta fold hydrolase [Thermoanaerobaculia bacterium]
MIAFAFALLFATQQIPPAIYTDPPHDAAHPAQMLVLHIPSGGVSINGVAYLAAGAGAHPTLVLLHGLPGNEKNLDLAQAVRRAGWNAITFNYRGSWGSPGSFRFAQSLHDADAVLADVRANAAKLGVDTSRIVIAGHSMGGWVTAMTAGHDRNLRGVILLSAANMGGRGGNRAKLVEVMRDNMESLANVTAESMADELIANAKAFDWSSAVPGLAKAPLLVLTADDGLAPQDNALADAVKKAGDSRVTVVHAATDHSWSDRRIELESDVIRWLEQLR